MKVRAVGSNLSGLKSYCKQTFYHFSGRWYFCLVDGYSAERRLRIGTYRDVDRSVLQEKTVVGAVTEFNLRFFRGTMVLGIVYRC